MKKQLKVKHTKIDKLCRNKNKIKSGMQIINLQKKLKTNLFKIKYKHYKYQ